MDRNDFETNVFVQIEKLTNVVDALAKQVSKNALALFGNGDIKKGLVWKNEQHNETLNSLESDFNKIREQIARIKADLKEGREEFNALKESDSKQLSGTENLKTLNNLFGWFSQTWKHKFAGLILTTLFVYIVSTLAASVPPVTLLTWLISLLSRYVA